MIFFMHVNYYNSNNLIDFIAEQRIFVPVTGQVQIIFFGTVCAPGVLNRVIAIEIIYKLVSTDIGEVRIDLSQETISVIQET